MRLTLHVGPLPSPLPPGLRALHVRRAARERYGLDGTLFATDGRVLLADLAAARRFAERINAVRGAEGAPPVSPGEVNAIGLVHEQLHAIFARVRSELDDGLLRRLLLALDARFGRARVDAVLRRFLAEFPPPPVLAGEQSAADYLASGGDQDGRREELLEELAVLWAVKQNPALGALGELFDDAVLAADPGYLDLLAALVDLLDAVVLPEGPSLLAVLRRPADLAPGSLADQLRLLLGPSALVEPPPHGDRARQEPRTAWDPAPAEEVRLLRGLDLLAEEVPRPPASFDVGPPLPAPEVDAFAAERGRPRAFSPEGDWMARLALVAKNTLVWLDQLSRQYGREIQRLDQIPERELERLARRGFSGLWLIGVWERSPASRTIKRRCGNPEAESSAYAVVDYAIAGELGGEEALAVLAERAGRHGLRLGSDMVPNHTAIDSRWVIEHPDWFIQTAAPPYAVYSFDGPDLSTDPRVGIFLEDHYYTRSDAAVVFKRVDRASGEVRYLYHGNDGTQTPWNDTAQLDYLNPEVRAAVLAQILAVARRFPILRFDAAMTLTRFHHHRLWYPAPGTGGDIPSRAEHGLTQAELDQRMPEEFWRQVVDRVAEEVPGTLLLAEAFWLMETYFVRTLGLHRVYNSAFMHALREERNRQYGHGLAAAQAFDRGILERYVNFMNNPDEQPAAEQFGRGDKAFAAATMLATLPGLPMFGHGQVEGLEEKYGMEYRRAYRDEVPHLDHVARHARLIAPLLARRELFASSASFFPYAFGGLDGASDDVFAYVNQARRRSAAADAGSSTLVIVHNRHGAVRGWIRDAADPRAPREGDERRPLPRIDLVSGMALDRLVPGGVAVLTDPASRHDFLAPLRQLATQGLYVELGPYETRTFLGAEVLADGRELPLVELAASLRGAGIHDLWPRLAPPAERSRVELLLACLDPEWLAPLVRAEGLELRPEWPEPVGEAIGMVARRAAELASLDGTPVDVNRLAAGLRRLVALPTRLAANDVEVPAWARELLWASRRPATALAALTAALFSAGGGAQAAAWSERLRSSPVLRGALLRAFALSWLDGSERRRAFELVLLLLELEAGGSSARRSTATALAQRLLGEAGDALGMNRFEEVDWLRGDHLADVLIGLLAGAVTRPGGRSAMRAVARVRRLARAADAAGYRVADWLSATSRPARPAGR